MVKTGDLVTDAVIEILVDRQNKGQAEYGVTLSDNNTQPVLIWIDEAIEELLDAVQYLMKFKQEQLKKEQ